MKPQTFTLIAVGLSGVLAAWFSSSNAIGCGLIAAALAFLISQSDFLKDSPVLNEVDRYIAMGALVLFALGAGFFGQPAVAVFLACFLGLAIPTLVKAVCALLSGDKKKQQD